jgi:hypothetical protein
MAYPNTTPNEFENGEVISASEHNENWTDIEDYVNGLSAGLNYVAGAIGTTVIADSAITTAKLANSSVTSAKIVDDTIVNADINSAAGIVDTKLATISTALKVSNSATTAASANTASAIVARDASGNFTAGTITATLTGNVTGNLTGNVTGNVTGNTSGSSGSCSGNAATATALATARNIGGVSFNGTANIDLPGVNTTGNQNTSGSSASTTGNAATATALATARTIGGVSFDGTASINLPGVNTTGNQDTSGTAANATTSAACSGNAATATNASDSALLNGYASTITGLANTVARVDGAGILAGTYFGMGQNNSTYWYATDYANTITIFRATNSGVYAQAITSGRAVMVNSSGTIGTVASTRRAKENIVPYSDPDNKILNVGAVTFDYKAEVIEEEDRANRFNQFGMIAEDLHDAGLNHLVHYDKDEQCSGINYQMLAVELLGVIKNLDARIKVLEGR